MRGAVLHGDLPGVDGFTNPIIIDFNVLCTSVEDSLFREVYGAFFVAFKHRWSQISTSKLLHHSTKPDELLTGLGDCSILFFGGRQSYRRLQSATPGDDATGKDKDMACGRPASVFVPCPICITQGFRAQLASQSSNNRRVGVS